MSSFLRKTFGGLSLSYYLRQLFFGGLLTALFFWVQMQATGHIDVMTAIIGVLNAFIYPYAKFVYESIFGFIFGDNVFFCKCYIIDGCKICHHVSLLCFCDIYRSDWAYLSIFLPHEKQYIR